MRGTQLSPKLVSQYSCDTQRALERELQPLLVSEAKEGDAESYDDGQIS